MVDSIRCVNIGNTIRRPRFISGVAIADAENLVLFHGTISAYQIFGVRSIIGVVGSREFSLNVAGTADPASGVSGFTARRGIAKTGRSLGASNSQIEFIHLSRGDVRCGIVNGSARLGKSID